MRLNAKQKSNALNTVYTIVTKLNQCDNKKLKEITKMLSSHHLRLDEIIDE